MAQSNVISISVSPLKLRSGLGLIVLWWIPAYLAIPALSRLLGDEHNQTAIRHLTIVVLIIQGFIGLAGALIVGHQLATLLKRVRLRRMPHTLIHMALSGSAEISTSDLKQNPPKS